MRRRTLDPLHNLRHAKESVLIEQWSPHDMNVIGHNDHAMQCETFAIAEYANFKTNRSCDIGKYPASISCKRHEDSLEIALIMRQPTPVFVFSKQGSDRRITQHGGRARTPVTP